MQLGFILVEVSASKRQHWSSVVVKNFLDAISGIFGFWLIGFGLAFAPTDVNGFIGLTDRIFTVSARFPEVTSEDLYLKWIF